MSDSRRRTPIFGMAAGRHRQSDKVHKVMSHRAERRAVSAALASDDGPPHPLAFGNPWAGDKDGKRYWTGAEAKDMRK